MKRLGEILVEHGYASLGELHTALETSHRLRTPLGTQLLRLGFVTEAELLEALSEQNSRPQVTRAELEAASVEVRRMLPLEVAKRLRSIPFARARRTLHVAFCNPRDAAAIDEIEALTGYQVRPFVATEVSLSGALEALAGELEEPARPVAEPQQLGADISWERLWAGAPPGPEELLALAEDDGSMPDNDVMWATYPGLSPVMAPSSVAEVGFVDEKDFERALLTAQTRDAVGETLLSYAARFLTRLCLFSVFEENIHGWLVHGLGPVLEDVRTFSVGFHESGVFQESVRSGRPHQGPPPDGEVNQAIAACLGDPPAINMVVVPVKVKDRPVAFLVGDIPGQSTISVPLGDLVVAADVTGVAFEMIILRRKIHRGLAR